MHRANKHFHSCRSTASSGHPYFTSLDNTVDLIVAGVISVDTGADTDADTDTDTNTDTDPTRTRILFCLRSQDYFCPRF